MLLRIILLILLGSFISSSIEILISNKPFTWWFDASILFLYYIIVIRPEVNKFMEEGKKS